MRFISKNGIVYLVLILLLSYWAIKPLLVEGYFPMHDDTQPSRVQQMAKALSYAQFPVRWVPDLGYGYGYPLFNFYAPLPYYVGALFHLLGFEIILATKLMFLVGILLSGFTMYLLISSFAGNFAGLTAGILYLYAPYHAVNIYVRGAVGEYYAYAFLPLIVLGVLKKDVLICALGLALVLLSHNILGMVTVYFLVTLFILLLAYKLVKRKNLFSILYSLFSILLGIGLSAFFTLPAVLEKQYTAVSQLSGGGSDFTNHFVYLSQLWQSDWGYAGSAPGFSDGMSFKIGKLHLILGVASFLYAFYSYKKRKIESSKFNIYLIVFTSLIVSAFLTLGVSEEVWKLLPGFPFIQYPWRFINLILLFLAFMPSAVFLNLTRKTAIVISFLIVASAMFLNIRYFQPKTYLAPDSSDYVSQSSLSYKISKISDEYLPAGFTKPKNESDVPKSVWPEFAGMRIKTLEERVTEKTYLVEMPQAIDVTLNLTYFPGWKVSVDGEEQEIYENSGKIAFQVPGGRPYLVAVEFSDTGIRKLANAISIFSLFLLVYVTLFHHEKKR